MLETKCYKDCVIPENLSFDEKTLFWRLRLGEGIPQRTWHRPLQKNKSWYEIKDSLDQKLYVRVADAIFQKVYPSKGPFSWLKRKIKKFLCFLLVT